MTTGTAPDLLDRARKLGLLGLIARWDDVADEPWVADLISGEETERYRRSLERRLGRARLGRFKAMADFEWDWPTEVDREQIEELFNFGFLDEGANVILVATSGLGKTMIAQNLAHQALLKGFTVRYATASALLNDLASQDSASGLGRRLRAYAQPRLLVIDEVGYLGYDTRYADLLFQLVSLRYQEQRPILLTTNRPFGEWGEVFPNAPCVVALVDRLVHRAEIVTLAGKSYRAKEAEERAKLKQPRGRKKKSAE